MVNTLPNEAGAKPTQAESKQRKSKQAKPVAARVEVDKDAQTARSYTLAPGDVLKGYLGAQWLVVVNAGDANGPALNGGDYYILEATNPFTPVPGVPVTAPGAISVFTPSMLRLIFSCPAWARWT